MSKRSEKAKEFGGNWYIINAAKNWLDLDLSFNMVSEVRGMYNMAYLASDKDRDEVLEEVLTEYRDALLNKRETI